jgi:hypothetical protein
MKWRQGARPFANVMLLVLTSVQALTPDPDDLASPWLLCRFQPAQAVSASGSIPVGLTVGLSVPAGEDGAPHALPQASSDGAYADEASLPAEANPYRPTRTPQRATPPFARPGGAWFAAGPAGASGPSTRGPETHRPLPHRTCRLTC